MKYRYLILICSLLLANTICKGQNFTIVYRHCFQPDTAMVLIDNIGKEAKLIGNENKSVYSLKKIVTNVPDTNRINEKSIADLFNAPKNESGSFKFKSGIPYDSIGDMAFFDKINDSIFVREKMVSLYVLTAEKRPNIDWKIIDEKKQILGYECTKASCVFRGRNYVAWFAPKIPISEGPWKFKGLPGLILLLEDDRNLVKIYAVSILFPSSDLVPKFQAFGNKINLSQYFEFAQKERNKTFESLMMLERAQEGYKESMFPPTKRNLLYMLEMHE